ncbi:hypothetical protein GW17_00048457 [Ensete ventricosum]|nr:hypothetical protein GW17_00048457 [Ensete ventricosum]
MLQQANQYVAAETLVPRKREDQKRPRAEQARGQSSRPPRRMERAEPPLPNLDLAEKDLVPITFTLTGLATACGSEECTPVIEILFNPTITTTEIAPTWMDKILRYKKDGTLPSDRATAPRLKRKQAWYCEVNGRLYHRSFSQPLLRDIGRRRRPLAKIPGDGTNF